MVSSVPQQMCFHELYDDVITSIFKYLSRSDLFSLRLMNKRLCSIVNEAVVSLDLSYCNNLSSLELKTITQIFPNLQKLKLPSSTTDDFLRTIVTSQIIGLDLLKCTKITGNCLRRVIQQHSIQELAFSKFRITSQEVLHDVIKKGGLKKLVLSNEGLLEYPYRALMVDDHTLNLIKIHLKDIEELHISKSADISDNGVKALLKECKNIEVLDLHGLLLTEETLFAIAHNCPKLKDFTCHIYGNEGLQAIFENCLYLTKVSLDFNTTEEAFIKLMKSCPHLTELTLNMVNTQISPEAFSFIDLMPNLKVIKYTCIYGLAKWFIKLIERAPNLECLEIHCASDDLLIEIGKNCPKLETLICYLGSGIHDEGIEAVAKGCSNLKKIVYENDQLYRLFDINPAVGVNGILTDRTLVALGNHCPKLEKACFNHTLFTDSGILHLLQKCVSLRVLGIEASNNITNWSLMAIQIWCPNLLTLKCFKSDKITSEILNALCLALPQLKIFTSNSYEARPFSPRTLTVDKSCVLL